MNFILSKLESLDYVSDFLIRPLADIVHFKYSFTYLLTCIVLSQCQHVTDTTRTDRWTNGHADDG